MSGSRGTLGVNIKLSDPVWQMAWACVLLPRLAIRSFFSKLCFPTVWCMAVSPESTYVSDTQPQVRPTIQLCQSLSRR